ncbi:flagellar motor switch protein FliN/FliY [Oribacterium sinus]|uniref:Flagellar motor switch protein FliN/FliY n=1 Tax=Oribacterium sinus TaxID=237576 RepID=A0A7W9SEG7_9FIRM|nr:flagellar motor switch protein FliN [Oribacterium sinus]MBB6040678.1 flagellar motor switch protein FliN/FliY [Oribacterium sinus]
MGATSFNEMEIDAIGEIMNISLGASATAISTLLGTKVNITTPVVQVKNKENFEFRELEPAIGVEIAYVQGIDGKNIMMFSRNDVRIIVSMMMGAEIPEDEFVMDEINASAIREAMNQMMGASATALSEFLGTTVDISTPISYEITDGAAFKDKYFEGAEENVVIRFTLEIEDNLKSEFLNIMSVDLVKKLLKPFTAQFGMGEEEEDEVVASSEEAVSPQVEEPVAEAPAAEAPAAEEAPMPAKSGPIDQATADALLASLLAEQNGEGASETTPAPAAEPAAAPEPVAAAPAPTPAEPAAAAPAPQPVAAPQPAPAQMAPQMMAMPQGVAYQDPLTLQLLNQMQQSQTQMLELIRDIQGGKNKEAKSSEPSLIKPLNSREFENEGGEAGENPDNREMLMKVPLEISVEIGRTRKLVKDILDFTQGSLVVLDKMAGEQADLYVNGECIAKGDIVVVEENFGIRITEILKKDINQESL